MSKHIKIQKYFIIGILLAINTLLSTTFIIYDKYWYAFLFILAIGSSVQAIMTINLILYHLKKYVSKINYPAQPINKRNYCFIIPCYNESREELLRTLDSVALQKPVDSSTDRKFIFIVCDGKVVGKGNSRSTDQILIEQILAKNIKPVSSLGDDFTYKTWDNTFQPIEIYEGVYRKMPYILIVKLTNYGKRDSLVLIRRFLFYYNKLVTTQKNIVNQIAIYWFNLALWSTLVSHIKLAISNTAPIDYIIGTDADTILENNCTRHLISSIEVRPTIMGCVGLVDISIDCNAWSPFVLYQQAEYLFAQLLKRQHQSIITHKVNCLSGCVQILRVGLETCGPRILSVFNSLPADADNIFDHIRSYASEDRNHVCHMLSLYPYVETVQNINAIAYTKVPTNFKVLFSQRRRWSLGATSNDLMLLFLRGINWWERITAASNIATFAVAPFIAIATGYFLHSIITHHSMLMLYLSIPLIIPFCYALAIPCITRMRIKKAAYYYISYLFFIITGIFINLVIFGYAVWYCEEMTWGKTRSVSNHPIHQPNQKIKNQIMDMDSIFDKDKMLDILSSETPISPISPISPTLNLTASNDATFWTVDNPIYTNSNSNFNSGEYIELTN